ncbi:MAG TPA: hypothetical protein VLH56_11385 [Dissulfurispiraceae bacterium]|nr:hypothetical protein [Dissulfurispiraceae bacterium]
MMTLTQATNGYILGIVSIIQKRYGWEGWKSRREMLFTMSRNGLFGIRFGAMPGFFEWEQTPQGASEYWDLFPVTDIMGTPRINPVWREEFRQLLDDMGDANLLPVVYLFGGCDLYRPLNPLDRNHDRAIGLYMREVVNCLAAWGGDYLIETGNEWYVGFGDELDGSLCQVSIADRLVSLGVPMDRIRLSALDNPREKEPPSAEWLQVAAFDPAKSSQSAVNDRLHRIGFSIHQVGNINDFQPWGYAGRMEVNGFANYSHGTFCNILCSTDGANWNEVTEKFDGVSIDDIGPLYFRCLEAFNHPQAGSCPMFEHLPNEAINWTPNAEAPGGKVATVRISEPTLERVRRMAAAYQQFFGHKPINAACPVEDEPVEPPTPPDPVKPDPIKPDPIKPEEDKPMKLFSFSKRFPFLNVHYKSWKRSLTKDQLRVHTDTLWLTWGLPAGLVLIGWGLWTLIKWLFNLVF